MREFLSRYRPRYLTALAYMLQATEYNLGEYLRWYHRTSDFSTVAKRKQLVLTAKSRLVLLLLWLLMFSLVGFLALYVFLIVAVLLMQYPGALPTREVSEILMSSGIIVIFLLAVLPWVIAYGITIPLWLGETFLQKPIEYLINVSTRRRLQRHLATKIAIAGSFGKTTLKEILATMLGEGKKVAATVGNQNTPIGISRFVKNLTGKEEVLIFEYGEYVPGDVAKFAQLTQPDIGVITGVNEAHLHNFKSLTSSAKNIFSLAKHLKAGVLYVNGENALAKRYAHPQHHLYSRHGTDGWVVTAAKTSLAGTSFTAKKGKKTINVKTKLLGLHQIGALVTAVAIAERLGLSVTQIERAIAKTKPFQHRLDPQSRSGVVVLDDTYNGNPDGVTADLAFLKSLKAQRRVYVTPGLVEMGERSEAVHKTIGKQLAEVANLVVLIKNSVTPFIEAGLREAKYQGELLWFDDALECYNALDSYTKLGDVVLLQNDWPDQYA